jgi:hypothetical protein
MSDPDDTRSGAAPVAPISDITGDAAVLSATGRDSDAWFALLDEAGATNWPHADIARWLSSEHGVPPWWTQNLSVRYEQARGMRVPGQQGDGTFTASRTATIDGTLDSGYAAMVAAFSAELGEPASGRADGKRPFSRWKAADGTSVMASAEVAREGRVRVAVVHEKLPDAAATGPAKEALGRILNLLS